LIDLHHHCLPGVDDGPETMEEAVALCAAAFEDGIRTIVATPHSRHPQFDCPADRAREVHAALVEALREKRIGLDLRLGAEIHWSEGVAEGLKAGTRLSLGGNRRWYLFELPASFVPAPLEQMVFQSGLAGWFPLLAHPERNHTLAAGDDGVARLRDLGVRTQVTAGALLGDFGKQPKAAAERWLKLGLVDCLASDAHDTVKRPPRLAAGVEAAARIVGRPAAERLVRDNPARILNGEAIP
jgi:protein-tyrosine phosphatase